MPVKRMLKAGAKSKLKREKAKARRKRMSAADMKAIQTRQRAERDIPEGNVRVTFPRVTYVGVRSSSEHICLLGCSCRSGSVA
jgi:hypothetical protein